ncbi:beta-lactamase [Actinobacteria bacterium OK074]|nr:beta-lactamase [Actinobacteria bacterium OK074]
MGGVAGHAGVLSTVDDLAVLARTILNGGTYGGHRILDEHGVTLMETDVNQRFPGDAHGLGCELNEIWHMGGLTGPGTLGHTGFTGAGPR